MSRIGKTRCAWIAAFLSVVVFSHARAATTDMMGFEKGTAASAMCPSGEYLAGVAFAYNNIVTGMTPYCVAMTQDGGWSGAARVHEELRMTKPGDDVRTISLFCPRDNFLTSFTGWTAAYGIEPVIQLSVTCLNVKSGWQLSIDGPRTLQIEATEWAGGACDDNSVATGVVGRVRAPNIVQFGFNCELTKPAAQYAKLVDAPNAAGVNHGAARRHTLPSARVGMQTQAAPLAQSNAGVEGSYIAPPRVSPQAGAAGSRNTFGGARPSGLPPIDNAPLPAHFAPPVFDDGALLWACHRRGNNACDGRSQALEWCAHHGFKRLVSVEPPTTIERGESIVKNMLGDVCEASSCAVIETIDCAK